MLVLETLLILPLLVGSSGHIQQENDMFPFHPLITNTDPARDVRLPLSTGEVAGKMAIVDREGARVKLACVNW